VSAQFNNGWETRCETLEIIDTRDAGAPDDIGLNPDKPFALVRLHRTFGGREVASLFDRYASRGEASAGLIALVHTSNPAVIEAASQGRWRPRLA